MGGGQEQQYYPQAQPEALPSPPYVPESAVGRLLRDTATEFTFGDPNAMTEIRTNPTSMKSMAAYANAALAAAAMLGGMRQKVGISEPLSPVVYVPNTEVELTKSFGGGDYWRHKTEGSILRGEPISKEEMPPEVYHVTTANDAVNSSGMLIGDPNMRAGLGKGTSAAHQGVSVTTSLEDAKLIEQELQRAVHLSKGNVTDFQDWMAKTAKMDEKVSGLKSGTLSDAVDAANQMYDVNTSRPDANHPSAMRDAYNYYLNLRESAGGQQNPILMGGHEAYASIDPSQIKILTIPSSYIPDEALIRKDPISKDFMHEVMIHSDVPIQQNPVLTESLDRVLFR